jgi:ABC-2 type transport system permease protein
MIFYFLMTILVDNLVTPTEDEWQIAAGHSRWANQLVPDQAAQLPHLPDQPLRELSPALPPQSQRSRSGLFSGSSGTMSGRRNMPGPWAAFALSTVMAGAIQFFIAYSLAMLAFWILEISTVVFILYSFEYFLSGQIFPLDIMPGWLQGFVKWSPLPMRSSFPCRYFSSGCKGASLPPALRSKPVGW